MLRYLLVGAFTALSSSLVAQEFEPEPKESFWIEGPELYEIPAGESVGLSANYTAWVTETENTYSDRWGQRGVDGFSISIAAEGITIEEITDLGTDAELHCAGCFRAMSTTSRWGFGSDCEGFGGAVMAYVFSFGQPIQFEPNSTNSLAVLRCSGEASAPLVEGDEKRVARLWFADGCQGPGQPVINAVNWVGESVYPTLGELEIMARAGPPACPSEIHEVQLLVEGAEPTEPGAPALVEVELPPETLGETTLTASLRSRLPVEDENGIPARGPQAVWASVALTRGDLELVDITPRVAFGSSFLYYELTSSARPGSPCEGFPGAAFWEVPTLTHSFGLHPVGDYPIFDLVVAAKIPTGFPGAGETSVVSGRLEWLDGCQGRIGAVDNEFGIDGLNREFDCLQAVDVRFVTHTPAQVGPFLPCDANSDSLVNVADPVHTFRLLFAGAEDFACRAAADCNGDFRVDVSDAIATLWGLFRDGELPPLECTAIDVESVPRERQRYLFCVDPGCS